MTAERWPWKLWRRVSPFHPITYGLFFNKMNDGTVVTGSHTIWISWADKRKPTTELGVETWCGDPVDSLPVPAFVSALT